MDFEPGISVTRGLDHLASRLGPIITERFPVDLGGNPWSVALTQLDELAGRRPGSYSTSDLYAQLKLLTRRLGALGFPFDDSNRTVSTLGRELLRVRNDRAHGAVFTALDAWRAHDFCARLLEHFDDSAGLERARELRREALAAYATEEGLQLERADEAVRSAGVHEVADPGARDVAPEEPELVEPDAEVFARDEAPRLPVLGGDRLAFEPWDVVVAGDVAVLDALRTMAAKTKVRSLAIEIVEAEGPIHRDRLCQLIAASFGMRKLHRKRAKQLARQVTAAGLHVDGERFVWGADMDPQEWREFRPSSSAVDRPFEHISPREIANAMDHIASHRPGLDSDDLEAATLRTFGRTRRTPRLMTHLRRAEALRRPDTMT